MFKEVPEVAKDIKTLQDLADHMNGLRHEPGIVDIMCELRGWHRIKGYPSFLCHDGTSVLVWSARIDTVFVDLIDNAYAEWVGYQLRNARQMQGLTLKQVAAMSGIPFQTIAKIEAGKRSPRAGTLARLVLALGICIRF